MIDSKDSTESTLRLILWNALSEYSTESLFELLEDKYSIVRTSSAKQLHRRPSEEVFNHAISLCKSSKWLCREIGAFILGQLGSPELPYKELSLPILVKLLDDKKSDVRAAALAAIGHLGNALTLGESLLDKIQLLINDSDPSVRLSCAFTLGSFGASLKALSILKDMLSDPDIDVREWAELSIEIINDKLKQ